MVEVRYQSNQNVKATVVAAFVKASMPHEQVRIRLTRGPVDSHLALYESDGFTPREDTTSLIPSITANFSRLCDAGL